MKDRKKSQSVFSIISLYMVRTRPGKHGKSWNLKILNARPGKSWRKQQKKSVSPGISLEIT